MIFSSAIAVFLSAALCAAEHREPISVVFASNAGKESNISSGTSRIGDVFLSVPALVADTEHKIDLQEPSEIQSDDASVTALSELEEQQKKQKELDDKREAYQKDKEDFESRKSKHQKLREEFDEKKKQEVIEMELENEKIKEEREDLKKRQEALKERRKNPPIEILELDEEIRKADEAEKKLTEEESELAEKEEGMKQKNNDLEAKKKELNKIKEDLERDKTSGLEEFELELQKPHGKCIDLPPLLKQFLKEQDKPYKDSVLCHQ